MTWIQGIQRAIDYVEANITEEINFEEAAKQAYSSPFHFQRVFTILCGTVKGKCEDYRYCAEIRIRFAGEFFPRLYKIPRYCAQ